MFSPARVAHLSLPQFKSWSMALNSTPLVYNHTPCSECPVHVWAPLPQTLPPSVEATHICFIHGAQSVTRTRTNDHRSPIPISFSREGLLCRSPKATAILKGKEKRPPKTDPPTRPSGLGLSPLTSKSISGYLRPLLFPRHLVFPPSSSWHQNPFFGSNLKRLEACR